MKNTRNKADTELVRQQNRSLVLETLRHSGTLASIELGEKTGLSPATISAITNDMLAERLIESDKAETEKHRNTQRGRPKVKLKLAENAARMLGIRLTHNALSLTIADFCGNILARHNDAIETASLSAEAFGVVIVDSALAFLENNHLSADHISIISVACQGSVDARRGSIIWSPAFSARNIPVAAPLMDVLNAPCLVANDTNAIAHLLHVEDETLDDSFAVFYLGSGIGLGLYVNGDLLEGAEGSASEFGHMLLEADGALCRCGRRGCIEAYASDFGIMRLANEKLAELDPADITPSQEDMDKLAALARDGDDAAKQAFHKAGMALGTGLGNLIMLANPKNLLFTGPGVKHFDLLEPAVHKALEHAARNGHQPKMSMIDDSRDLIESGLLALGYTKLDREIFAKRVSIADVAARNSMIG
ncbi:MAG: ROK family transcriptional regulator [Hyphomicrobiales bacterium]